MITHYFIYRADHTDRLKFKGVDKLILREVVGDFRAIPNIAQYEIYLRTDIAMPKVYSDPDPVHPAQGEYAALTEYKYTQSRKKMVAGKFRSRLHSRAHTRSVRWITAGPRPDDLTRASFGRRNYGGPLSILAMLLLPRGGFSYSREVSKDSDMVRWVTELGFVAKKGEKCGGLAQTNR